MIHPPQNEAEVFVLSLTTPSLKGKRWIWDSVTGVHDEPELDALLDYEERVSW